VQAQQGPFDAFSLGLIFSGSAIAGPNGADVSVFGGIEFSDRGIDFGVGGTFAGNVAGRGPGAVGLAELDVDSGIFLLFDDLDALPTLETRDFSLVFLSFRLFRDAGGTIRGGAITAGPGLGISRVESIGQVFTFEGLFGTPLIPGRRDPMR